MNPGADTVYQFAGCELDLAARTLRRDGAVVALQPRVFDLLAFLIAERHRAVDKDAIQDAVWRPMIVSETALTRAIMKARRAVGDDADQQSVIRTIHGHGYQFVASIDDQHGDELTCAEPVPESGAVSTPSEAVEPPRRRALLVAALTIAALTAAVLFNAWQPGPESTQTVRIAVLPVTNLTGDSRYDYAKLGLMSLTNDLLADTTTFELVSVADVLTFMQNKAWNGSVASTEDRQNADQLRRAFGASHVLISELETNPGGLRLNYSLLDRSAARSQSTMVSDQSGALVRGMVRGVAALLGQGQSSRPGDMTIIDDDPFINEAYARAVSIALEGRCAEAAPLFDVVLARNPNIVRARIIRANCLFQLGRSADAEAAYRGLLVRDDIQQDASLLSTTYRGLGKVLHEAGRRDAAHDAYQSSLRIAERADDKAAIGPVLISMSVLAKDRRNFVQSRELLARATLIYRQLEWDVLPGYLFSGLANIAMSEGKLEEAEQHLDDALTSFRGVGDRRNEAMMLNNYGYLRRLQGRFADAEPLHLQSLEIRRDIGDHVGQGRILGMLSTLYARGGRLDDAKRVAEEAVSIARAANDRLFIATGLAQLGAAERRLGNYAAARSAYVEAGAVFTDIEDVSRAAQVTLRLSDIDVELGDNDAAAGRIADVLQLALAEDLPEPAIEALLRQGDLLHQREQPQQAILVYERALQIVADSGVTTSHTTLATKLAALYLDAGDIRAAEPLLGHIIEQEQTVGTLRIQARYAMLEGAADRAHALMRKAKKIDGHAWSDADERLLQDYVAAASDEAERD